MNQRDLQYREIPEPSREESWFTWAHRVVLWWKDWEQRRRPVKPVMYVSTAMPSAAEDGVLVWVRDLGVLAMSSGGVWINTTTGGVI